MPRPILLSCAIGAIALTPIGVASAQPAGAPNLVGTWKGIAHAVHIGSNPYRVAEKNGPNFPSNGVEFTFAITEQQGNRFAGSATGGKFSETIIGAVNLDNRTGLMLDDDGTYTLTLRDPNTMDLCYQHSFATSRVVACFAVARSPS